MTSIAVNERLFGDKAMEYNEDSMKIIIQLVKYPC